MDETPLTDPEFLSMTFVVIDFEALTPAGRPPEPIEVAAVAGRFGEDGSWRELGRCAALMRPPDDVAIAPFDLALTGLTERTLRRQRPAGEVMADLDRLLDAPPYRLVAHHAHTEANLIAGQRRHCPVLAGIPLLCTVKLARVAYPELPRHNLDALLRHLRIPRPADRHRALPDVLVTVAVLRAILRTGAEAGAWTTLRELQVAGGVAPGRAPSTPRTDQTRLF